MSVGIDIHRTKLTQEADETISMNYFSKPKLPKISAS